MKSNQQSPICFNHVSISAIKNKKKILKKISKIIDSGNFLNGSENKLLENNIKSFLKEGYITLISSGHDALLLALLSLNLSANDEVIFPVNAYPTAFPTCLSLAKPVLCDVDENGQIDPEKLKEKITDKTRAIIAVHLYGLVGDIEKVKEITKKKNVYLIEDCAQAFGSLFKEKPVGTFGDISCFSFYPTKNFATLGDGGAVWTKHKNLFRFILNAKSYGEKKKYYSEFISGHSRLSEIQSGILNIYFKDLEKEFKKRRKLADFYANNLCQNNLTKFLRVLKSHPKSNPIRHLFVIEAEKRDQLMSHLKKINIMTSVHYPTPVHLLPAFSFLKHKKGDFPVAEKLSKNILSIPFHQHLKKKDIETITNAIENFYYG